MTVKLSVFGKEYQPSPTFKVAADIQGRTGKTLAQAVFAAKALSVVDLHAILCSALAGEGLSDDVLGDAVIEDYKSNDTHLCSAIIAFGESFFPAVEGEGVKK